MGREEAALSSGCLHAAAGWQRSRRHSQGALSSDALRAAVVLTSTNWQPFLGAGARRASSSARASSTGGGVRSLLLLSHLARRGSTGRAAPGQPAPSSAVVLRGGECWRSGSSSLCHQPSRRHQQGESALREPCEHQIPTGFLPEAAGAAAGGWVVDKSPRAGWWRASCGRRRVAAARSITGGGAASRCCRSSWQQPPGWEGGWAEE